MAWDFRFRMRIRWCLRLNLFSVVLVHQCVLFLLLCTKLESVASFQFDCDSVNKVKGNGCYCGNSPEGSAWEVECPRGAVDVHNITIKVKSLNASSAYASVRCNAYNDQLEMPWRMLEGLDFREQQSDFNVTVLSIDKCALSTTSNTLEDFFAQVKLTTSSILSFTFLPSRNPHNATFELLSTFIASLENLETLELKMNKLTKIPSLNTLPKLRDVGLMTNEISQIPPDVFSLSENLQLLDLGLNKIETLQENVFPSTLRRLYLQNNKISRISNMTFSNLKNLELLVLRNNPLLNMDPDSFSALVELKTLDLHSTNYTNFPILRNLPKIETIILSYRDTRRSAVPTTNQNAGNNTMSEMSLPLRLLENLTNLPTDFHDSIGNLSNLVDLTLTSIGLESLPDFKDVPKLAKLKLNQNKIKEIPRDSFSSLTSLTNLDLSQNFIEVFSGIRAQNLDELDVSQNNIKNLSSDAFNGVPKITRLKLQKNKIDYIHPNAFESLTHLKYLDLSENNVTTLSHLPMLPAAPPGKEEAVFIEEFGQQSVLRFCLRLEELKLSHNNINAIYDDWKLLMAKLRILDLSHNKLSKLFVFDINFFARNLKLDLSFNEISTVSMNHADYLLDGAENRALTIKMDQNPLNCDCLLIAFRVFNLQGITFDYRNLSCAEPPNLKGIQFRSVKTTDLTCPLDQAFGCPSVCSCWKIPVNETIIVDCSYRNLSDMIPSMHGFNGSNKKYFVSLNLAGNGISNLNANHTKNLSDRVTQIDFTENEFVDLSFLGLLASNNKTTFYLAQNKFNCDCEFHNTLRSHYKQISDYKNVSCLSEGANYDGQSVRWLVDEIPESQICPNDALSAELRGLVIAVGVLTACVVILVAIYIRHGWALRAFLYSKGIGCCLMQDDSAEDNEKIYDAFVSFSHKDEDWVLQQLVNRLEEQEGFKLCLHFRDWTPGDWIPDQIVRSVDKSRRTVVILSKNFVESIWSRLEFKAAHSQALNEKGNRLILILMGEDLVDSDVQDDDLKVYMKMNTYLKWGDPWFWHKLKYALPHKKSVSVQNHYVKQQQRERAIQLDKLRTKMESSVV